MCWSSRQARASLRRAWRPVRPRRALSATRLAAATTTQAESTRTARRLRRRTRVGLLVNGAFSKQNGERRACRAVRRREPARRPFARTARRNGRGGSSSGRAGPLRSRSIRATRPVEDCTRGRARCGVRRRRPGSIYDAVSQHLSAGGVQIGKNKRLGRHYDLKRIEIQAAASHAVSTTQGGVGLPARSSRRRRRRASWH